MVRVENCLLNDYHSLFDIQGINIRLNDIVLILSDYLCWLSGEGVSGMWFGADYGKSSTVAEI